MKKKEKIFGYVGLYSKRQAYGYLTSLLWSNLLRLSFQGYLYNKQPWKTKIVSYWIGKNVASDSSDREFISRIYKEFKETRPHKVVEGRL